MSDNRELTASRSGLAALHRAARLPDATTPTQTDEEECVCYGFLRGIRERSLSIEFRFEDGNSVAYPYSWLGPVQYNPSAGLLLKLVGDQVYLVLIEGSNLNALVADTVNLYDRGIQRHRVTWVREMTRQEQERAGESDVVVERIRTLSYRPDDQPKGVVWLEPFRERD